MISNFVKDRYIFLVGGLVVVALAIFWSHSIRAAQTAAVTATVTPTNLAISVNDTTIAFGSVALSTATTTAGNSDTITATNDGSNAKLNVKSGNASGGVAWTLGTSIG